MRFLESRRFHELLGGIAFVGLVLFGGWLWSLGSLLGYWPRVAGGALELCLVWLLVSYNDG